MIVPEREGLGIRTVGNVQIRDTGNVCVAVGPIPVPLPEARYFVHVWRRGYAGRGGPSSVVRYYPDEASALEVFLDDGEVAMLALQIMSLPG